MIARRFPNAMLAGLGLLLLGCGSSSDVEVVDMDRVLEILDRVSSREAPADAADPEAPEQVHALETEKPAQTSAFLAAFAKELNGAKLVSFPIGVHLLASGAIEGFRDRDGNGAKDTRDDRIFTIEIDPENGRVVATQQVAGQTYHRDRTYHRHYGGGMWGYWIYGSMWGRQRSYYDAPGRTRPRFTGMAMSPRGYHASAVSRARSASRGARSRGGSRSFGGGK